MDPPAAGPRQIVRGKRGDINLDVRPLGSELEVDIPGDAERVVVVEAAVFVPQEMSLGVGDVDQRRMQGNDQLDDGDALSRREGGGEGLRRVADRD